MAPGWPLLRQLDSSLRAGARRAPHLLPATFLTKALCLGAVLYGLSMGLYSLRAGAWPGMAQILSSGIKLPFLYLLTIGITLPSLYVFGTLLGLRLKRRSLLRAILASTAVMAVTAASLAPILGFFTLSTRSYGFMVLLNVLLLGIAGIAGLAVLLRALGQGPQPAPATTPARQRQSPPTMPPPPPDHVNTPAPRPIKARRPLGPVLFVWLVLFASVGAQGGWVLRPFIGAPGQPFALFRATEGTVLDGIFGATQRTLTGDDASPARPRNVDNPENDRTNRQRR